MALIPLGYPSKGRWAQPRRRPVEEVVHWGHWGDKRARPAGQAG
jgi:nitroreductase